MPSDDIIARFREITGRGKWVSWGGMDATVEELRVVFGCYRRGMNSIYRALLWLYAAVSLAGGIATMVGTLTGATSMSALIPAAGLLGQAWWLISTGAAEPLACLDRRNFDIDSVGGVLTTYNEHLRVPSASIAPEDIDYFVFYRPTARGRDFGATRLVTRDGTSHRVTDEYTERPRELLKTLGYMCGKQALILDVR